MTCSIPPEDGSTLLKTDIVGGNTDCFESSFFIDVTYVTKSLTPMSSCSTVLSAMQY
jgi:hypothetical protein